MPRKKQNRDYNENDYTGNNETEKGEVMAFMKDIEEESKSMMQDLTEIDGMLESLNDRVEAGRADNREILRVIEKVRLKIGVMEREDKRELNEEEVAESLLSKLKKWVQQVV
jgi:hypothetical protein